MIENSDLIYQGIGLSLGIAFVTSIIAYLISLRIAQKKLVPVNEFFTVTKCSLFKYENQSDRFIQTSSDNQINPFKNRKEFIDLFLKSNQDSLEKQLNGLIKEGIAFDCIVTSADAHKTFKLKGLKKASRDTHVYIFIQDVTHDALQRTTTEQEYKEFQKKFYSTQNAMDQLPWPIWIRTAQQLLWCNQPFARILGVDRDTALSQQEDFFNKWLNRKNTEMTSGTIALIVDGERRSYQFSEVDQHDGVILGYGVDLTESEKHKAKLESHAVAYREVLDNLSAAVSIYGPNKRLRYFNHAYLRMFDFEESWLYTEPTLGEVLDDLRARRLLTEHADYAAYKKEQMNNVTTLIAPTQELLHLPDGRTIRMISAPHPMGGSFYICEDVTNALNLERKYNTQIAVQKASLDNLYEGIAVFGGDNRLRLHNSAFSRMWKLSAEQLKAGRHLSDMIDDVRPFFNFDENWPAFKSKIINSVTDRTFRKQRVNRKDGSVLEFNYAPLPDGSNLMSYIDVSDSCRIEKLLRERNEALEEADNLKSELIANVSYELRTPLNHIIGFSDMLANQYVGDLNRQQQEYCDNILSSSQNLLAVVNDILDLAMIQAGFMKINKASVAVDQLIRNALKLANDKIEKKGLKLSVQIPSYLGYILVDESRMIQAIYNLILNAIKMTPQGRSISLSGDVKDDFVLINVTGSEGRLKRVDSTNYANQTEPAIPELGLYAKAGLELKLARSIIEMHGGRTESKTVQKGHSVLCFIPQYFPQDKSAPLKAVA
jgi:signal transduction histidine kinase